MPTTTDRREQMREYSAKGRADLKAKLSKWQARKHRCPTCKGELHLGTLDGGKSKECCPYSAADLATRRCPRWLEGKHYRLEYKE